MKTFKVWVDERGVILNFDESNTYYRRPLSYLGKVQRWIVPMYHTGNYTFRPFLGHSLGIVAEKGGS